MKNLFHPSKLQCKDNICTHLRSLAKECRSSEDQGLAVELLGQLHFPHPPVEAKLDLSELELVAEALEYPGQCLGFLELLVMDSSVLEVLEGPEWYQLEFLDFLQKEVCLLAHHLLDRHFPEVDAELEGNQLDQPELDWLVLDLGKKEIIFFFFSFFFI